MEDYGKKINNVTIGFKEEDVNEIRRYEKSAILLLVNEKFEISKGGYPEQYQLLKKIKENKSETDRGYLKEAESKIFQIVESKDSQKKKTTTKEISTTFKYGEVISLTRPKVLFGINPYGKFEYNGEEGEKLEERRRKVLFKILFDSYAFVDGKVENLFIPFFFSSKMSQEVWYHLVYSSLSRYLQINFESKLKCVALYFTKEEYTERENELSNLLKYLDSIESKKEVDKVMDLIPKKKESIDDIVEEDENEGEESEEEDKRDRKKDNRRDKDDRREKDRKKGRNDGDDRDGKKDRNRKRDRDDEKPRKGDSRKKNKKSESDEDDESRSGEERSRSGEERSCSGSGSGDRDKERSRGKGKGKDERDEKERKDKDKKKDNKNRKENDNRKGDRRNKDDKRRKHSSEEVD